MSTLQITVNDDGITNVAIDGEKIGLLKRVEFKTPPDFVWPEITIEAFTYEGMSPVLVGLRRTIQQRFPWVKLIDGDPVADADKEAP